ncbi:MAG: glycosyltransferase family protein [Clostridia bacterium]|nr:glycosyltransferase family protein [Clostridia bacterium]
MAKVVCIVQARMGSSRLPGKVLKDLMGKPMLAHLVDRLKMSKTIDEVVIATTTKDSDQPIIHLAEKCQVQWFAGAEDDVLSRYLGAAQQYSADIIIRVTSDCPLIDPGTLDQVVEYYLQAGVDYVSNTMERTFPRGLDVEVFSYESLKRVSELATDISSREHVTLYMYRHPELFTLANVVAQPPFDRPDLRICVDTEEDFVLMREIYEVLYRPGGIIDIGEVMSLFAIKPELAKINAHIEQKKV